MLLGPKLQQVVSIRTTYCSGLLCQKLPEERGRVAPMDHMKQRQLPRRMLDEELLARWHICYKHCMICLERLIQWHWDLLKRPFDFEVCSDTWTANADSIP